MQSCRKLKVGSLKARARVLQCDTWEASHYAHGKAGLPTWHIVKPATLFGRAGNSSSRISSTQSHAAAGCARYNVHDTCSAASTEVDTREHQGILRNTFPLDHTQWKGRWNQKTNRFLPEFCIEPGGALWPDNFYRPAWVDSKVATLDARMDHSAPAVSALSLSPNHGHHLVGPESDTVSVHVKKLCQKGQVKGAVEVMEALVGGNSGFDKHLFYTVLKECMAQKDLMLGRQIHALAVKTGLGPDTFLCNHFIRMYAGHGKLQEAMDVFTGVALPDTFMWSSILLAHVKQGQAERAVALYKNMRASKIKSNSHVFVAALQACAAAGDLESGKQVHNDVLTSGMEHDMFVCNCLVDMYAKCGSLKDARTVFDRLGEKNVVTWSAMIAGYARKEGMGQQALDLYSVMHKEGMVAPNSVTFVCLLQACGNVGVSALEVGKELHSQLKDQGLESDVVVGGSLVNMYVKCGNLEDARIVFDRLGQKNVVTWNAMISGYAQQKGTGNEALSLYSAMHNEGMLAPNAVTFVCLLQACANVGTSALEQGKELHSQLKGRNFEFDVIVGGSLVNMYVKCGSLEDARIVFDRLGEKNVVTWNAMMTGYTQQEGMGQEVLHLYSAMLGEGVETPDAVTFVCLLQACANLGVSALEKGKELHSQLKDKTFKSDVVVGGSLVDMYVKCGSLKDARIVFDGLAEKDVVTWTAMIAGYAQQEGRPQEALNVYSAMRTEGSVVPNAVTYLWLLEACASVGALRQGQQLHSEIRERGLESNVLIGPGLVQMYAKCGCLDVARKVFDKLAVKNLVTWTALLKGYAEHGEAGLAIQCFKELLEQGMEPDVVTYVCLLNACSHAGLVNQGQHYFETMVERHGVEPNERLYSCMVDLLGRSGHLDKAEQILRASGLAGNAGSWTALLSACKSHGDVETGKRCFDQLVKLDPSVASAYVVLGSIYASAGRWDEVGEVERLRKAAGARKMAARACIEVNKEVHEFSVGEGRSDVAAALRKMNTRAKEGGHVPQTHLVLRPMREQEKEDALCGHAEKLALAYGLLHTPAGSTLVVTKNLRMCDDCHSSTKIMSRVEKREIVVRDGHKVHRFQRGACSCLDRP